MGRSPQTFADYRAQARAAGAREEEIAEALAVLWAVGSVAERTWPTETAERPF